MDKLQKLSYSTVRTIQSWLTEYRRA